MSIEDRIQKEPEELQAPELPPEETEQPQGFQLNLDWLWADSPDEPIESYIEHPLNFGRSKGIAQALRGLEGIFGNLRKAVIDIIIGTLNYAKERNNDQAPN